MKIYTIYLIVVMFFGIITNSLLIYHFFRQHKRKLKHYILFSMAVTDIFQCIIGFPLQIIVNETSYTSDPFCISAAFNFGLVGFVSIMHFAMLAIERFARINSTLQVNPLDNKKCLVFAVIWGYGLFWAVTPLLGWGSYQSKIILVPGCSVKDKVLTLPQKLHLYGCVFLVYIIALVVTVACHVITHCRLKKNLKQVKRQYMQRHFVARRQNQVRRFDIMTLTMTVVFFVAWTPFAYLAVFFLVTNEYPHRLLYVIAPLCAKACVFINPPLYFYYYFNEQSRMSSFKLFFRPLVLFKSSSDMSNLNNTRSIETIC